MVVYFNGHYVDKNTVAISPEDRGFNFADGVYEVIRSYNGNLFRPEDHFKRLYRNLSELRLEIDSHGPLEEVPGELLKRNQLTSGDATVYLQVTRGTAPRSHPFPETGVKPTIYASAAALQPQMEKWEKGIQVICVPDIRWARCDIKSISLLANVLANQQAIEADADEALFIRDGAVTEGTLSNFGAVFDGCLWTYPESNYILPGISRQVVLELCDALRIPVDTRPIMVERLRVADEALVMGTTKEVTPVIKVDNHIIADGNPGPITVKLQHAFRNLINS